VPLLRSGNVIIDDSLPVGTEATITHHLGTAIIVHFPMKAIVPIFPQVLRATVLGVLLTTALPAHAEAPASLRERQERIIKVTSEVASSVVAIVPDFEAAQAKGADAAMGSGSGVIVSADGLILTAAHVLQAVGEEFEVILSNGDKVKAKSLGKAYGRDAALGQITDPGTYPHVTRAEPGSIKEGDWALALGHPGGYEVDRSAPLRLGRILEKDVDGFIVSDCTLSGGDSGGPLFDLDGKLIGIHSSIGWRIAENRHVPMEAFEKNWDRLMKGDEWGRLGMRDRERPNRKPRPEAAPAEGPNPNQPMLGVSISPSELSGAMVDEVVDDSPARKAGVKVGDVITKVNGLGVDDGSGLISQVVKLKPGDEITLTIERGQETLEFKTTLVAAKDLMTK
jgi:serine protease Do